MADADPLFDSSPPRGGRPPAVRPRDASTLIILRKDGKKPRLLMGRRNKGHNFMPGMWVFPGGRIDRSDYHAPSIGEFKPETERRLRLLGLHFKPLRNGHAASSAGVTVWSGLAA